MSFSFSVRFSIIVFGSIFKLIKYFEINSLISFTSFLRLFFSPNNACHRGGFALFFGGTSLLILVAVVLDTLQQIESYLLMRKYDGLVKSGRIKGRSGMQTIGAGM